MYKLEHYFAGTQDPYYKETVEPDEAYLLDRASLKIVFALRCHLIGVR